MGVCYGSGGVRIPESVNSDLVKQIDKRKVMCLQKRLYKDKKKSTAFLTTSCWEESQEQVWICDWGKKGGEK